MGLLRDVLISFGAAAVCIGAAACSNGDAPQDGSSASTSSALNPKSVSASDSGSVSGVSASKQPSGSSAATDAYSPTEQQVVDGVYQAYLKLDLYQGVAEENVQEDASCIIGRAYALLTPATRTAYASGDLDHTLTPEEDQAMADATSYCLVES